MARLNTKISYPAPTTHEGAIAPRINAEQELRRSVLAHLLWEDSFYEDGESAADRIKALVPKVPANRVAALAVEARTNFHMRHVPLLLARELARHGRLQWHILDEIIQRPDELTEFLAIYWKDGKQPLSKQVKKGLAAAFTKFNEYSLAKYNRDGAIKLRDVLFLSHAKPLNQAQAELWTRLIDGTLATPDTWEVELSTKKGVGKTDSWLRLLSEKKLGGLALLRNLRNMLEASVPAAAIREGLASANFSRVLPFRFIAAARHAPTLEPAIEKAMLGSLEGTPKLKGDTLILVDVSGSMLDPLSAKSDMSRMDAAAGLAVIARELAEDVTVATFSDKGIVVPPRRGFALRDAVVNSQPHSGTYLGKVMFDVNAKIPYDRIIVITDEQAADDVPGPLPGTKAYMINVAHYKNGIGYGKGWTNITGFSEAIFRYIMEIESGDSVR